jgi:hypothetical protein
MSVALLDVNVLVALFDPSHQNHEAAHRWFGRNRKHGWATCPITANGCVRVLSNPRYPTVSATPEDAIERLARLCSAKDHQFWSDGVSIADEALFQPSAIRSYRTITDAYLLGLAVRYRGRLVTFDRSIPTRAVKNAAASNLVVLA